MVASGSRYLFSKQEYLPGKIVARCSVNKYTFLKNEYQFGRQMKLPGKIQMLLEKINIFSAAFELYYSTNTSFWNKYHTAKSKKGDSVAVSDYFILWRLYFINKIMQNVKYSSLYLDLLTNLHH